MNNPILGIGLRGTQIVFAAIVFGLSVHLVRQQVRGNAPISLGYASFVGAASLVGGFIGMASNFVEALQGIIGLAVDGFLILANLAGGVLIAVQLKGAKCDDMQDWRRKDLLNNDLIFGGCGSKNGESEECGRRFDSVKMVEDFLKSRCKASSADSAFMFLTLIVLLVVVTFTWIGRKR